MAWQTMTLQDVLSNSKNFDQPEGSTITSNEFGLSSIVECFICEMEEINNRGKLPEGWRIVDKYDYILCPECAKKLVERIKS